MGVAVFLAPGFFIADRLAVDLGYSRNGYSIIYQVSIIASALFFATLAMLVLGKTLSRFFPQWMVSLLLVLLYVGTNLFIYVTTEPGMSHVYSFFLIACFIELSIRWYENRSFMKTIGLGVLIGMIALVRPTNVLIVLFLFFYGVKTESELRERTRFFLKYKIQLLVMLLAAIACWIPQMLYWKQVTGELLYFSYNEGERFYFNHPMIIQGLFGYHKGWLLYTPLMLFALFGIAAIWKLKRELFWATLIFLVLNCYVIFSWWCWWYGGSFGQRPMVDSYPLMSLALGYFIYWIINSKRKIAIPLFIVFGLFIYLNQFQAAQYRSGTLHWDSMSKQAYWKIWGTIKAPQDLERYLEPIDYDAALKGHYKLKKE
jgi:hypothetical protein